MSGEDTNMDEVKRISVGKRAYSSGVVGIMYERIDWSPMKNVKSKR